MQVPMLNNLDIDKPELRRFSRWLASFSGINGLVTNGHTGEVFSLTARERAEVTGTVAEAVDGALPVISGLACEGILDGVEQAKMAKGAGATGLLVMPFHHWLRFGHETGHVIEYFTAIGEAVDLNIVVHVYPAWTKSSYSAETLCELASLPWVTTFKVGTREMSKYAEDIGWLRSKAPDVSILTCHDEYLLASMVQGVDGALVGFASFIPELITALYDAVKSGDLHRAQEIQARILPLKDAVYSRGEPSGEAHARMKTAMVKAGRLKSAVVRPPAKQPTGEALRIIEREVEWCEIREIHADSAS